MSELTDLDTMLNGINTPPAEPPPVPATAGEPQPTAVSETTPAPVAEIPAAEPPKDSPEEETAEQIFSSSKQNVAFAQMRTENKALKTVVDRMSKIMGLPPGMDMHAATAEINRRLIEAEAKESQVPAPLLQELDNTKNIQLAQEMELRRTRANLAFQEVAGVFKLSKQELREFAETLLNSGKNPFTEDLDLLAEYKVINFDKEMKKARDEAVKQHAERQAATAQHSTQPISTVGASPPATSPVQSVRDLDILLDSRGK